MTHIALHFLVPAGVAVFFFRRAWPAATLVMIATMLVDLDHLLANPVYDPERCSIGFHPLHTPWFIGTYLGITLAALQPYARNGFDPEVGRARWILWCGLGLVLHMLLDAGDCML